ncbi:MULTISPECIES: AraC family transcriptional regulator [unclassified Bacillus (in: firmicutes)]|uniref:AraC family transcriptional regulator n=1 Tax=unclassified Bacillus (in: firmicutes) TaxID=185979 RepID=UPI0008DF6B9E|nr:MULTISPECIES: AraC family transcriptional regulator [unclassified Bacillus (in: firmicutes)]SFB09050.1 AraC-type DNA-binding protein [Bacillus sp. UNCCL13]SFQ86856.1 AraC-type DNA-binding protein [Bacillus sp. cl95]
MTEKQNQMISLFNQIIPKETVLTTAVTGLSLFRIEDSFSRTPYSYSSEIIILAQGEKVVYLGDDIYTYDSSHYLVLPVPLPAECEGRVKMDKPILGLSIDIDPIEVGEILLAMEDNKKGVKALPKGIYSSPMNDAIYDATTRLLKAITDPQDKRVLAPMIKREIIYRVLQGENGEILQSLLHRNRRFFQIAKVIQKINESYSDKFDIDKMAEDLEMSNSTFHSSFKSVTNTSPLQYIKNVRLHKARTLMIQDGLNANSAAFRVGYESPSQFSREYKRLFGATPSRDVAFQR